MPQTSSGRVQSSFLDVIGRDRFWAFGDSLTKSGKYHARITQQWPHLLVDRINATTGDLVCRNFGEGGGTTSTGVGNALEIVPDRIFRFGDLETPWIATIAYGINDPGAAIGTSTTQANLEALIMAVKHKAVGYVSGESSLPSGRKPGERFVVATDGSSTGGCAAPSNSGLTARITGSQTGPTVWECRYAGSGVTSWGRVAIASTAPLWCQRIVVVGTGYQNWASDAGDNVAYQSGALTAFKYTEGTSTVSGSAAVVLATYSGVRSAQAAAVNAQDNGDCAGKVVFCNLYEYQSKRIADGLDTQGSGANHHGGAANNNIHWTPLGHGVACDAILQTIKTAGW